MNILAMKDERFGPKAKLLASETLSPGPNLESAMAARSWGEPTRLEEERTRLVPDSGRALGAAARDTNAGAGLERRRAGRGHAACRGHAMAWTWFCLCVLFKQVADMPWLGHVHAMDMVHAGHAMAWTTSMAWMFIV